MWPWKKRVRLTRPVWARDRWKPTQPLFHWSKSAAYTCEDSYSGTFICGATSSGKTTGSGETLLRSFLQAGYGGLALLIKDDRAMLESLCRKTGRMRDVIRFAPGEPWKFNFLDNELTRTGRGRGYTENVVEILMTAMHTADRGSSEQSGQSDGRFWEQASRQLCRNLVELASQALGRISVTDLHALLVSAPLSRDQVSSDDWKANSFCWECLCRASLTAKTEQQKRDLRIVADYFRCEFAEMGSKQRQGIVSSLTVVIDALRRGVMHDLFCSESTFTPEACEHGTIILCDMPLREYGAISALSAALLKFAFQRSIERRNVRRSPRPVFVWADESQFAVTPYDQQFLSTCRSSRVAVAYLTQNLVNLYTALGGNQRAQHEVDSMLGNMVTKIFHANGDPTTNQWASTIIGRKRQFFMNSSVSNHGCDWYSAYYGLDGSHTSTGMSEQMEFEVQPSEFTRLRSGGRKFKGAVDAIVVQSGRVFPDTHRIWRRHTFQQSFSRRRWLGLFRR